MSFRTLLFLLSIAVSSSSQIGRRSPLMLVSRGPLRRLEQGRTAHPNNWDSTLPSRRRQFSRSIFSINRGGTADYSDEEDYDEYDEADDDFSDFSDALFEEDDETSFGIDSTDFSDDDTLQRLLSSWSKTPPFTKLYITCSTLATLAGYLTQKNREFPDLLQLEYKSILTKFQIWRPITAFWNLGPLGVGYLMTAHFVWTYMSTLERLNHEHPYDFWFMMGLGGACMVVGYAVMGISPKFLGHNLSTFMVYIWSRYHEGLEVNMFELFNARAELLPWLFLAQTFLLEGEFPILDLLGIAFGHMYHHYKTSNIISTPKFIINWYNGDSPFSKMIRMKYKEISSDFQMQ